MDLRSGRTVPLPTTSTSTTNSPSPMSQSAASTTKVTKPDATIERISLSSTLDAFDVWSVRLAAYVGREKPDLFPYTDPTSDAAVSEANNSVFACLLLPHVGDDVIAHFRKQLNITKEGVTLFRLVCQHFATAAPEPDLAEDVFLRGFRLLQRDRYSSLAEFLREVQLFHKQVCKAAPNPFLEKVLVLHALQQLCLGTLCPWAPAILAKVRTALRGAGAGHPNEAVAGVSIKQLLDDVSAHIAPTTGARDSHRYSSRPQCHKCGRYGHTADRCRANNATGTTRHGSKPSSNRGSAVSAVSSLSFADEEQSDSDRYCFGPDCECHQRGGIQA